MIKILTAAAVLAALVLAVTYYAYRQVFHVRRSATTDPYRFPQGPQYDAIDRQMHDLVDRAVRIPYEDVWTTSFDGLRLHGRYYGSTPGAPVQILCHGFQSNAVRDFCGGMPMALEAGTSVIIIDQRAHGQSEGRYLSLGILERQDVLSWIHYVLERFGPDTDIILQGISMGGATVLMSAELDLPENVRGIMVDCPYTAPKEILFKVMRDRGYPPEIMYPFVKLAARLFCGFDLEGADPREAVKHWHKPILFIHGEDDRFVPHYMGRENYEAANEPKTMVSVPEAGHGLSYMVDYDAYAGAAAAFLQNLGIGEPREE